MDDDADRLFYLGGGPLAAMLLGMALVPLRDFTTASNVTFAFLALTIAVAEFGGRSAAVATALTSALSLDFFLNQALSAARDRRKARHHRLRRADGLRPRGGRVRIAEEQTGRRSPGSARGPRAAPFRAAGIERGRSALPVAAVLVRDPRGYILAASEGARSRPVPDQVLDPDRLRALPGEGGRLALVAGERQVGWLDVWGDRRASERRVATDALGLGRLLALLIV